MASVFEDALDILAGVKAAQKALEALPAGGDAQEVDLPHEVEISVKGKHYVIESLTVRRVK